MSPLELEISAPEYDIDAQPDYKAIGTRVDALLAPSFADGQYIIRAIGSADHPGKSLDHFERATLVDSTAKRPRPPLETHLYRFKNPARNKTHSQVSQRYAPDQRRPHRPPGGRGTSVLSTGPNGGGRTGKRAVKWRSNWPICCPTAGGTGCIGKSCLSRTDCAAKRKRARRSSAPTAAGAWALRA